MEDAKMKKTYINPNIQVVIIGTQQMLAASVNASISGTAANEDALGHDDDFDW